MLPSNEINIYPKSEENLKALISFYFDKFDVNLENALDDLIKKTSLSLNQLEYILKNLSDAYIPVFKKNLSGQIALTNLFTYGFDALANPEISCNGSKNRKRITQEFKDFVDKRN